MKTPTPHKTTLGLLAPLVFCYNNIVQVQIFALVLSAPQLSGLCFVFRAQTFFDSVGAVLLPCVLATAALERKSLYVTTTFLHCAHETLRGFDVAEDIHLSQVMSPSTSTSTNSMNRRNILMRSGQGHADSSGRKPPKKFY